MAISTMNTTNTYGNRASYKMKKNSVDYNGYLLCPNMLLYLFHADVVTNGKAWEAYTAYVADSPLRNTNTYKIRELRRATFSVFYKLLNFATKLCDFTHF